MISTVILREYIVNYVCVSEKAQKVSKGHTELESSTC